ncbi:MAG TPA: DUF559 domain-containing protein [Rhodoglobus sp.]|nr:DUF559 domain-containing protein [Rhodoglobus sp.]
MRPGPRPAALPPDLPLPLTVAEALTRLSRSRIGARDLFAGIHGVRGRAPLNLADHLELLAARLPEDAFFSHHTAALMWDAPLPWRQEQDPLVHVTVAPPARAVHAKGLRGHRRMVLAGDVRTVRGLRVSSPERTWCELGSVLALNDLVAVGDHLLRTDRPRTSRTALSTRLDAGIRLGGISNLRAALPLLDGRSHSRPETFVRLLFLSAGLDPDIQHVVVETETGIARRADFAFPRCRLIVEYQGDYHRSKRQWRSDMRRRAALEEQGWRVLEINAEDLREPEVLIARVRRLLAH